MKFIVEKMTIIHLCIDYQAFCQGICTAYYADKNQLNAFNNFKLASKIGHKIDFCV